jgi:tRNA dimethylallyltransferase
VPHHLIDLVDPDEPYSAGRWRRDALARIHDVLARKKIPPVGGTMLYYRASPAVSAAWLTQCADIDAERRAAAGLHYAELAVDQKRRSLAPNDSLRIQRWRSGVSPAGRYRRSRASPGTTCRSS